VTVSFEDLVAAATVGVSRRPLTIEALQEPAAGHTGVLDTRDPAAALLDAAALLGAGRRAGVQPVRGVACPAPADDDGNPELPARAARALRQIAAADQEILADLLTATAAAGYQVPAPMLPELLDIGTRTIALRRPIIAAAGPRGRWLAARRDYWKPMAGNPQLPAVLPSAPWTDEMAEAAVMAIRQVATGRKPHGQFRMLVTAAVRNVPVTGPRDYTVELTQAAESGKCPQAWAAFLRRAVETINLRHVFYEEIR